jgi:hypothetical protein
MQNNSPDKLLNRDEVEAELGLTRRFLELSAWRGDGPPMMRDRPARSSLPTRRRYHLD